MARRGFMSDQLREQIAVDLGVYDTVRNYGWGAVSSRDCGRVVRRAIEIAEQAVAAQTGFNGPTLR